MSNKPTRAWSCRYSSCEMMYLDLVPGDAQGEGEVLMYLSHSPASAERWTFAQVLAGGAEITRLEGELRNLFGQETPEGLRESIRADIARVRLSPEEQKEADRRRRRAESRPQADTR
jgi:hypothetical protein